MTKYFRWIAYCMGNTVYAPSNSHICHYKYRFTTFKKKIEKSDAYKFPS